ncbi:MAG: serine/threonine protein kinase [Gammaproteobacteria bacterium]|nr:MAG: serine/threonine protein kinase [Gammaproteobacteria bacterium]
MTGKYASQTQLSLQHVFIMESNVQHRRVLSSFLIKQFKGLKISVLDPENESLPGRDYDWGQFDLVFISMGSHYHSLKQWYQNLSSALPPVIFLDSTYDPDEEVIEIMRLGAIDFLSKHKMKPDRLMRAIHVARSQIRAEAITEEMSISEILGSTDIAQDIHELETQIAPHLMQEDIDQISGVMNADELNDYIEQKLSSQGFYPGKPIDLGSQQEEQFASELERTGQISTLDINKTQHYEDVKDLLSNKPETGKRSVAPGLLSAHSEVKSIEQFWPFTIDDIHEGKARIRYYTVIDLIGIGGMATVFKAMRDRDGDITAMKILNTTIAEDRTIKERFIREFEYSKGLSHDHLVQVYAQGFEGDIAYIVMELLQGVDLRTKIRKRDVSPNMAMIYLRQIAIALDALHKHDIIHRDLKPSNIMFRNDGTLVVADFGVSKKLGGQKATDLTREGEMVGTPFYVSPEQALGKEMDERSDLYALGMILYEMFMGRHPYHEKKGLEVMYAHVRDPIPLLPNEFDSVNDILVRLLAKEPEDRFSTAEELIQAIEAMDGF